MSLPTLPLSSLPYHTPSASSSSPYPIQPDPSPLLTQRQVEAFINLLSTALARDQAEELRRQRMGVIGDWATPRRADQSGLTLMRKMREFEGLAREGRITGEQMAKLRRLNSLFRARAYQLLAVSHDRKVRAERERYQTQEKASQVARYYQQQLERRTRESSSSSQQQLKDRQKRDQQRQLQAMMAYRGQPLAQGGSRTRSFDGSMGMPSRSGSSSSNSWNSQQGPTSMDVLSELFLRPPGSAATTPTAGTPMYLQPPALVSSSSNQSSNGIPISSSAPASGAGNPFFPSPSPPSSSSDAPSPTTPPSYAHGLGQAYSGAAGSMMSPTIGSPTESNGLCSLGLGSAAGMTFTRDLSDFKPFDPNMGMNLAGNGNIGATNLNMTPTTFDFNLDLTSSLNMPAGSGMNFDVTPFPDMNPDRTIGEEWWTDPALMDAVCGSASNGNPGPETANSASQDIAAQGGGNGMGKESTSPAQTQAPAVEETSFDFSSYVSFPEDE